MKCENCGTDFEGNICPSCNKSSNTEETIGTIGENTVDKEVIPKENSYSYVFPTTDSPIVKKKKSKRLVFEIVGIVLLIIFMFSSIGKIPASEYEELENNYATLISTTKEYESELFDLSELKTEYEEYKERMKPYESLEKSEAEARKIEADKVAAEKKAAEDKAAAEKKAEEDAAAKVAAEEAAAEKAAAEKAAAASIGQKNALRKAKSYLDYTAFSYSGLIEQIKYEGFSDEEATYAADNCGADWNDQAAKKAQSYLEYSSFSREGLIEQLQYEGFSAEQAAYGASAVGY